MARALHTVHSTHGVLSLRFLPCCVSSLLRGGGGAPFCLPSLFWAAGSPRPVLAVPCSLLLTPRPLSKVSTVDTDSPPPGGGTQAKCAFAHARRLLHDGSGARRCLTHEAAKCWGGAFGRPSSPLPCPKERPLSVVVQRQEAFGPCFPESGTEVRGGLPPSTEGPLRTPQPTGDPAGRLEKRTVDI